MMRDAAGGGPGREGEAAEGAGRARFFLLGLFLAPALPLLAWLVAPHLRVGPGASAALVFAGGALTALSPLVLAACAPLGNRLAMALVAGGALALGALAILNPSSIFAVALADAALVAFAHGAGGALGRRVQHPGHLLPACVVAAVANLVSVLHPSGPTHAIVRSERALAVLAVSFPVPGERAAAPVLGLGDLLFIALLLGAASAHGLPIRRVGLAGLVGVLAAAGISILVRGAAPALVTIAAAVLLFVPEARRLRAEDRQTAKVAVVLAIAVGAGLLLQRWIVAA